MRSLSDLRSEYWLVSIWRSQLIVKAEQNWLSVGMKIITPWPALIDAKSTNPVIKIRTQPTTAKEPTGRVFQDTMPFFNAMIRAGQAAYWSACQFYNVAILCKNDTKVHCFTAYVAEPLCRWSTAMNAFSEPMLIFGANPQISRSISTDMTKINRPLLEKSVVFVLFVNRFCLLVPIELSVKNVDICFFLELKNIVMACN